MPTKLLLIDSDESFMRSVQAEAPEHGFAASAAANSDMGLALARREKPDLLVICVEAQPTNGYMLCTRLKKDDALKDIPVILTSANATPESFEKHSQLKTRADAYLIKPILPSELLEKASEVLGLPGGGPAEEEEIVSMEEEPLGMSELLTDEEEAISLTDDEAAEARGLPEAPADEELVVDEIEEEHPRGSGGGDEDLQMFDQAFDALGMQADGAPAAKSRPPPAKAPSPAPARKAAPARPARDELSLEGDEDLALSDALAFDPAPRAAAATAQGDDLAARVQELEQALGEREQQLQEMEQVKAALETEALQQEAAAKAALQRAEALAAAAKKFERELSQAREELKASGGGRGRVEELERRIAELETESSALVGEKELLSTEREELRQKLADAEETSSRNEERAVRAYQKMKTDERLREKTRQALQVALQLLDESAAEAASSEDGPEQQSA